VDDPDNRVMIEIGGNTTAESYLELTRFKVKCGEIANTLRKLKREAAGYLNEKDDSIIQDFLKDMRTFIERDYEIFTLVKAMNERRQKEIQER
jgi:hypothetical protein